MEDLTSLNARAEPTPIAQIKHVDPLALDYMIEGSRLGSKVLKKHWAKSSDPPVLSAHSYFSLQTDTNRWRDICQRLSALPIDSPRAARITQDTCDLFDLFYKTAQTPHRKALLQ